MTTAIGTIGASLGQVPLEVAVQEYGWREAMYTASIGGLTIAILVWLFVPRRPNWFLKLAEIDKPETASKMFCGLREVVSDGQTWLIALVGLTLYLPISTFAALWGDEFVKASTGVSDESAAWAITMLFFGFAAGGPIIGWLSDKFSKRRIPMLIGGVLCTVSMGALLLASVLPFWVTVLLLTLSGFFAGAQAISFAMAVEKHLSYCRATAVAFVNFVVMLGGFMLQPAFGALLDIGTHSDSYSANDLRIAMFFLTGSFGLGTVLCYWVKETK
jgi:sugar phosphate permease